MSEIDKLEKYWPNIFKKKSVRIVVTAFILLGLILVALEKYIGIYNFFFPTVKKESAIYLNYFTKANMDEPTLVIANTGNAIADSIWLSQKFYIIDSSKKIYECDLPRHSYSLYNGSEHKMFDLKPHEDTIFTFWQPCFVEFWGILNSKFDGKLIMRWRVEFSDPNLSDRQSKSFFFFLDAFNRPIRPENLTGGVATVEQVELYERNSVVELIKWVSHKGEFILNPDRSNDDKDKGIFRFGAEDMRAYSQNGFSAIVWECTTDWPRKTIYIGSMPPY